MTAPTGDAPLHVNLLLPNPTQGTRISRYQLDIRRHCPGWHNWLSLAPISMRGREHPPTEPHPGHPREKITDFQTDRGCRVAHPRGITALLRSVDEEIQECRSSSFSKVLFRMDPRAIH